MTNELKRTPLFEEYAKYGAKTVDFGGWELPVQFSSIKDEHDAVRNRAGLFDVSHMGEILVTGPDALDFLQNLLSNDVSKIATPLSLILLGASFKFDNIKKYLKQTTIAVVGKTILTPCIILPICIMFGYRGVELSTLMIIFAAPTAISSFTMAQQMDSDSDLAGQIVVFTSAFCVVTVFMWIFILKQSHLI